MNSKLNRLYTLLEECECRQHIMKILNYDMETACPKGGMNDLATDLTFLSEKNFKITNSDEYKKLIDELYDSMEELDVWDKRLVVLLHDELDRQRNVTPELFKKTSETFTNAYPEWLNAKEKNNYNLFKPTLKSITEVVNENISVRNTDKKPYDVLLEDYEKGFTTATLDPFFDELEKELVPLIKKIKNSEYQPRHDFINRRVSIEKQEMFSNFLLKFNGFDFTRGSLSKTEHPFTEQFGKDDVRVTTKYIETNFISNMYSIIHEGGHALFGQNIPEETFTHHLGEGSLSMGKHESVSRFYENIIGKSREYIHAIYPTFKELFSDEFSDVSENDLYEGVNYIDFNNKLRTEADELTYTLHIIIRYRLEKEIMSGKVDFDNLDKEWNKLYKQLLDIDNIDASTGILQDVHWSSGFGYFPTYSIGNALNCIYAKKLDHDLNLKKTVYDGNMSAVLEWMKENVFKTAPLYDTLDWIKRITGEEFSAKLYADYLIKKYSDLYHLN